MPLLFEIYCGPGALAPNTILKKCGCKATRRAKTSHSENTLRAHYPEPRNVNSCDEENSDDVHWMENVSIHRHSTLTDYIEMKTLTNVYTHDGDKYALSRQPVVCIGCFMSTSGDLNPGVPARRADSTLLITVNNIKPNHNDSHG